MLQGVKKPSVFYQKGIDKPFVLWYNSRVAKMEKSPSPVYGARLELVYGLIAHRGFESLLLRQS